MSKPPLSAITELIETAFLTVATRLALTQRDLGDRCHAARNAG